MQLKITDIWFLLHLEKNTSLNWDCNSVVEYHSVPHRVIFICVRLNAPSDTFCKCYRKESFTCCEYVFWVFYPEAPVISISNCSLRRWWPLTAETAADYWKMNVNTCKGLEFWDFFSWTEGKRDFPASLRSGADQEQEWGEQQRLWLQGAEEIRASQTACLSLCAFIFHVLTSPCETAIITYIFWKI